MAYEVGSGGPFPTRAANVPPIDVHRAGVSVITHSSYDCVYLSVPPSASLTLSCPSRQEKVEQNWLAEFEKVSQWYSGSILLQDAIVYSIETLVIMHVIAGVIVISVHIILHMLSTAQKSQFSPVYICKFHLDFSCLWISVNAGC